MGALEMSLINCKNNLILTWFVNVFIVAGTLATQVPIFAIIDTKTYLLLVTLSSQDNAKIRF